MIERQRYPVRLAAALAALEPHERAEVYTPAVPDPHERPLLIGATGPARVYPPALVRDLAALVAPNERGEYPGCAHEMFALPAKVFSDATGLRMRIGADGTITAWVPRAPKECET